MLKFNCDYPAMDGPGDHIYQFLKRGSLLSNCDLAYSQ